MKVYYLPVALVTFATFIHTALASGLQCSTDCAACWKDGSPGTDIKFVCNKNSHDCGSACPTGYSGIHCASNWRCVCNQQFPTLCSDWGPCWCGATQYFGRVECNSGCAERWKCSAAINTVGCWNYRREMWWQGLEEEKKRRREEEAPSPTNF